MSDEVYKCGMTEKESTEVFCPLVSIVNMLIIISGMGSDNNLKVFCGGSKCGLWRWLSGNPRDNERRGYCGLGGKP